MSDVDGLLRELRGTIDDESSDQTVILLCSDIRGIIVTIEQQRAEIERARERCECGAFNPDPSPEPKQPCGCEFVGTRLVHCPRHVIFGRLPAVRFTDGTIHHYDEDGNCYAESGPKPC